MKISALSPPLAGNRRRRNVKHADLCKHTHTPPPTGRANSGESRNLVQPNPLIVRLAVLRRSWEALIIAEEKVNLGFQEGLKIFGTGDLYRKSPKSKTIGLDFQNVPWCFSVLRHPVINRRD